MKHTESGHLYHFSFAFDSKLYYKLQFATRKLADKVFSGSITNDNTVPDKTNITLFISLKEGFNMI